MNFFKTRLIEERKIKKITQQDLAAKLNLSISDLAFFESGEKQPDIETLSNLADFFNVSTDYLLGRSHDRQTIQQEIKDILSKDPILHEFWGEISRREDLQLLFKQTRDLNEESIYRVIELIKTIEDEEKIKYGG